MLIYTKRAETRKGGVAMFHLTWNVHVECLTFFTALHMSANDCESSRDVDFGVTNQFSQTGKFANMESGNSEG